MARTSRSSIKLLLSGLGLASAGALAVAAFAAPTAAFADGSGTVASVQSPAAAGITGSSEIVTVGQTSSSGSGAHTTGLSVAGQELAGADSNGAYNNPATPANEALGTACSLSRQRVCIEVLDMWATSDGSSSSAGFEALRARIVPIPGHDYNIDVLSSGSGTSADCTSYGWSEIVSEWSSSSGLYLDGMGSSSADWCGTGGAWPFIALVSGAPIQLPPGTPAPVASCVGSESNTALASTPLVTINCNSAAGEAGDALDGQIPNLVQFTIAGSDAAGSSSDGGGSGLGCGYTRDC